MICNKGMRNQQRFFALGLAMICGRCPGLEIVDTPITWLENKTHSEPSTEYLQFFRTRLARLSSTTLGQHFLGLRAVFGLVDSFHSGCSCASSCRSLLLLSRRCSLRLQWLGRRRLLPQLVFQPAVQGNERFVCRNGEGQSHQSSAPGLDE